MSAGFSTGENVQEETEMRSMSREEIRRVIEGKGEGLRVPILYDFWIGKEVFHGDEAGWRQWLEQYPRDIDSVFFGMPGSTEGPVEDPDYFWAAPGRKKVEGKALDAQCLIENWEEAEDFFSTFPDPESPAMLTKDVKRGEKYLLAGWWGCFFERLWALRGMENALMDFYLYPEEVHRLFDALTDFYLRAMERVKEAWDVDCFFASDDIGTQTAPFFCIPVGILNCFCRNSLRLVWMSFTLFRKIPWMSEGSRNNSEIKFVYWPVSMFNISLHLEHLRKCAERYVTY